MKTRLLPLLLLTATAVSAHSGHPAPESHGIASHLITGLLAGLGVLGAGAIGWRLRKQRTPANGEARHG